MKHFIRSTLKSGFTVIELLIVIVIIGILATLIIISYNGIQQSAKDKSLMADAETVEAQITRYSTKNNGAIGGAVAWYSGGAANANIKMTPSPGNVIDVATSSTDYCIRVYNPGANKNSIENAYTKGYTATSCDTITASVAAGGSWVNPTYTSEVASIDPPIAWWKLNSSAADSIGSAGGTLHGVTSTTGQNGLANGAYSFDGVDDYIDIGLVPVIGNLTNNFTTTAWINPTSTTGAILGVARENSNDGVRSMILSGAPTLTLWGVAGYTSATSTVNTGSWYFLAFVMNSSNQITFYVNGVRKDTFTASGAAKVNTNDRGLIGASSSGGVVNSLFSGVMDDVRVYNRSLSDADVLSLYTAGAQ